VAEASVFPDCCGIIIVNKFMGGHPGSDTANCIKPTPLNKYLMEQERKYYGERAGLLAILSEQQDELIGHVFEERKWKLLLNGTKNGRTGAKLFMYFRDLNPTDARKKRIFGE
jgi:hypothetical protein